MREKEREREEWERREKGIFSNQISLDKKHSKEKKKSRGNERRTWRRRWLHWPPNVHHEHSKPLPHSSATSRACNAVASFISHIASVNSFTWLTLSFLPLIHSLWLSYCLYYTWISGIFRNTFRIHTCRFPFIPNVFVAALGTYQDNVRIRITCSN